MPAADCTDILKSGDKILTLLQALNREHGKTIIMVTHDPHASARASRTVHLDKRCPPRLERDGGWPRSARHDHALAEGALPERCDPC